MAFIPVPNVARLTMKHQMAGQEVENVFHVLNDDGWDMSSLLDVANAAATGWTDSLGVMPVLGAPLVFKSAHITDLTSDTGLSADSFNGANTAGGTSGTAYPNNVAFAIHKQAVIGGRHNKGRVYIGGINSGLTSDANTMQATKANDIVTRLQGWQTGLEEAPGIHLGFVSYVEHGAPLSEGVFVPTIGYGYTDLTLDSQRRRLPGRGV